MSVYTQDMYYAMLYYATLCMVCVICKYCVSSFIFIDDVT